MSIGLLAVFFSSHGHTPVELLPQYYLAFIVCRLLSLLYTSKCKNFPVVWIACFFFSSHGHTPVELLPQYHLTFIVCPSVILFILPSIDGTCYSLPMSFRPDAVTCHILNVLCHEQFSENSTRLLRMVHFRKICILFDNFHFCHSTVMEHDLGKIWLL